MLDFVLQNIQFWYLLMSRSIIQVKERILESKKVVQGNMAFSRNDIARYLFVVCAALLNLGICFVFSVLNLIANKFIASVKCRKYLIAKLCSNMCSFTETYNHGINSFSKG